MVDPNGMWQSAQHFPFSTSYCCLSLHLESLSAALLTST